MRTEEESDQESYRDGIVMPLLIVLKEPSINLIVEGKIDKDKDEEYWDGVFNNGALIVTRQDGMNMVIPLWKESNITFIQEVTQEQIDEQKKKTEESNKGNRITSPGFVFPSGKKPNPGGRQT